MAADAAGCGAAAAVRTLAGPPDRLVDAALFLFAVGLGGLAMSYLWHTHGEFLDAVDLAAGSLACLALWQRRSRPVGVFVLAFAAGSISPLAAGASLVAICSGRVARARTGPHSRWRCWPPRGASRSRWSIPVQGRYSRLASPPSCSRRWRSAGGCTCAPGASWSPRSGSGRSSSKPTRSATPSWPARRNGAASPGRCTTCWPTGCPCSAFMPGRCSSTRTRPLPR